MSCLLEIVSEVKPEWQTAIDEMVETKELSQILVLAYQLANLIARDLVEALLAKRASAPTQWGNCPKCGRKLESKGRKQRQLETMIGRIRWKRASGRCRQKCAIGQQTPLDVELGIEPYQKTERRLQRLAILLAIFVPFDSAAMLLNQLLGIQVSATSIWNWVQEKGSECMRQLEAELNALSSDQLPDPEVIDPHLHNLMLLIGADGVMVAFRPENGSARGRTRWREVKVGIFARLQQYRSRAGQLIPRLTHHRVVAVLGDIDDLASRMRLEAFKQSIWLAPKVVWLSDGARGFWRLYREQFQPYAVGILDFYHASQNLWLGLRGWLDGRTTSAKLLFRLSRRRLRSGQSQAVLGDIQAALQLDGLPVCAQKSLSKIYNYLYKHRDHIQYDAFKQSGCPIGSGFVESTCKWLIQQRFKGVGMRWSEDGFNHLLHLRLAWVNGRFDDLFLPPSSHNYAPAKM